METYGIVGTELINFYSEENPILNINDNCYFLFANTLDYHRPMVGRGIIIDDKFDDGMNKIYYIKLLEIIETPKIIADFVTNNFLYTAPYDIETKVIFNKKSTKILPNFDFSLNLFCIEGFFVRNTLEVLIKLRKEYTSMVRNDILKQIQDIDNI